MSLLWDLQLQKTHVYKEKTKKTSVRAKGSGRMSNNRGKTRGKDKEEDEVEELLRAAEDEMLLKLSLDSHLSSSSSSLDRDLVRRFEALKLPSVSSGITKVPPQPMNQKQKDNNNDDELDKILGGDLSARFSSLRASSSSSSTTTTSKEFHSYPGRSDGSDHGGDDHDEDDEVSKIIQWAMDAARLDPSRSNDEEDDDDIKEDDEEEEDERKGKPPK